MRLIGVLCLAGLLVSSVAPAQDSWLKREYTQWTDKEVQKLFTDSPWATEMKKSVSMADLMQSRRAADSRQGPAVTGPTAVAGSQGTGRILITLGISWQSALPLRRAVVRSRVGLGVEAIPPDLQRLLQKEPDDYVVLVTGMPIRQARAIETLSASGKSSMRVGKKPPVTAKSMELRPRTETVDVLLTFPRTQPVTLDDKEVELLLKLGPLEAKKKFTLKQMVYNGKLEL